MSAEIEVVQFKVTPPASIVSELRSETQRILAAIAKVRAAGARVPGMDEIERGVQAALDTGRLAWLRRALSSYIARKCCDQAAS